MAGLVPFNRRKPDLMTTGIEDFQNMLDDFFADFWPFPFRRSLMADTFKVDVQNNEREYIVEAELPGVQKKDINLSLEDGRLGISVNRSEETEEKGKNYIHKERRCASMVRNIYLADAASGGIKAKLEDGVLTIRVPKVVKPDNKVKIEIE